MKLDALLPDDPALSNVAACLAEQGLAVTRVPAARLASSLMERDGFDLVAIPITGDAEADASICRALQAAAPDVTLAVVGPLPAPPALAMLLDAGAHTHIVTSLGAPLLEAGLLVLARTASARSAKRRAPELADKDPFRRLVERSLDALFRGRFAIDDTPAGRLQGRFTFEWITEGFTLLTGITRDDIASGYAVRRLIHPADLRAAAAWLGRVRAGEATTIELRIVRKSGEERWIRGTAEPLRDRTGKEVIGALGAFQDITARVRASEELRDRTAALEEIIQSAPLPIIAVDYAGVVTQWNPAAERLFGWTAEEALGRPNPIVPREGFRAFLLMIENAFCGKIETMIEASRERKHGPPVTVSLARAVLHDARGAPTGIVNILTDVTERRQLEAKLHMADRLASIGRLAATVGHEINNPLMYALTNLNLAIEQIERAGYDAEMVEMLREAREGAERVRVIVRDLRMFSQAEAEARGPVDPRRVLDACVGITRVELRHRARVARRYEETPMVIANEARLGQVLLNLLINAADSITGEDPEQNEISLSTRSAGDGRVTIEVRDTGSGMPREVLDHIFEPFFTTKIGGHGTGLGLSVCYSLVHDLGGEITVESEVGRGSCFSVHLPAAPAAKAPTREGVDSLTETRMRAPRSETIEGKGRARLLIIDDETQVARAIARLLREHDVTIAENGQTALRLIQDQAPFDAILCDLMMPDLTGMDVYEQIRKDHAGLEDRMIFMTGGVFTEQAEAFMARVQNPRLEKPFDQAAVKGVVVAMFKR